jgi:hypothetical protein
MSQEVLPPVVQLEDGIYFGLPMEDYLGQNRIGSSGVRDLLVSPADFWANSWLNPDRERKETAATVAGEAYHMARLEPDRFVAVYHPNVSGRDLPPFPDAIHTGEQVKAVLAEMGQTQTKKGERTLDTALRLKALGETRPILPVMQAEREEYAAERGLMLLDAQLFQEIKTDMERLHHNPEAHQFLTDGCAEVTILWTDEAGVRWKIRPDYLRQRHVIDVKTFDNAMRKPVEKCISDQIAYNGYYIQAVLYWQACERIRTTSPELLPIRKIQNKEQRALIDAIRKSLDPFEFWWVFQQKGGVPNVLCRQLQRTYELHPPYHVEEPTDKSRKQLEAKGRVRTEIWKKAELLIQAGRDKFLRCYEAYGAEPWRADIPVSRITDENFSSYFLEEN